MKFKIFLCILCALVTFSVILFFNFSVFVPRLIQDNQTISKEEKREFAKLIENDSVFFPENYLICEKNEIIFEEKESQYVGVAFKFIYKINNFDLEIFKNELKSNINNHLYENITYEQLEETLSKESALEIKSFESSDNNITFFSCNREYDTDWQITIVPLENQISLICFLGHTPSQEKLEKILEEEKQLQEKYGNNPIVKNDGYFRINQNQSGDG